MYPLHQNKPPLNVLCDNTPLLSGNKTKKTMITRQNISHGVIHYMVCAKWRRVNAQKSLFFYCCCSSCLLSYDGIFGVRIITLSEGNYFSKFPLLFHGLRHLGGERKCHHGPRISSNIFSSN